ncbi:hypothetical protein RRG08_042552 [Elysia crispata]|uniref:Uncharacterized protein n=1 Tax=Elysia crispata TaxID=231223 RepID=A0AAE0XR42_9GAST|nr:hypothetical protein RRG08_042552 [Elysia crispata]
MTSRVKNKLVKTPIVRRPSTLSEPDVQETAHDTPSQGLPASKPCQCLDSIARASIIGDPVLWTRRSVQAITVSCRSALSQLILQVNSPHKRHTGRADDFQGQTTLE